MVTGCKIVLFLNVELWTYKNKTKKHPNLHPLKVKNIRYIQ